jgi:hypothetical protein
MNKLVIMSSIAQYGEAMRVYGETNCIQSSSSNAIRAKRGEAESLLKQVDGMIPDEQDDIQLVFHVHPMTYTVHGAPHHITALKNHLNKLEAFRDAVADNGPTDPIKPIKFVVRYDEPGKPKMLNYWALPADGNTLMECYVQGRSAAEELLSRGFEYRQGTNAWVGGGKSTSEVVQLRKRVEADAALLNRAHAGFKHLGFELNETGTDWRRSTTAPAKQKAPEVPMPWTVAMAALLAAIQKSSDRNGIMRDAMLIAAEGYHDDFA